MTRIIAGEFGGRRLAVPRGRTTRPTADRVREAWMSILAPRLPGARVLDLFAGTGALGLEALSRGAAAADFVEQAPAVLTLLRRNIAELGVAERARVIRADGLHFATGLAPGAYQVALADPPYGGDYAERLAAAFRLVPFADLLALEHESGFDLAADDVRRYGDTAISFFHAP
jgi:16S rRNA (guanine966-N2)-methyltransferase